MTTARQLRDEAQHFRRAGMALLAHKGASKWTAQESALWDEFADRVDRVEALVSAGTPAPEGDSTFKFRARTQQHDVLSRWIRDGDAVLTEGDRRLIRNTMSTTTGSQGGYTVGIEVAKDWVSVVNGFGGIRRVARRIIGTGTGTFSMPTSDGATEEGEIVGENAQAASQDPSFGTVGLYAFKFSSKLFTVPIELMQDASFDVGSFVLERSRDRIGRIQNRKFTVGTGTGEPTGLTVAASVGKTGAAGQTTTFTHDDLADLIESVDAGNEDFGPLSWQMSQAARKAARKIKDTAGRPIWTPDTDADYLLGYRLVTNPHMPAPAANAKSVAFGQMQRYIVHDRLELMLVRIADSAYLKSGQVGFVAFARAGGNLTDATAVKLYQHPAS